jgi:hypothetical protein
MILSARPSLLALPTLLAACAAQRAPMPAPAPAPGPEVAAPAISSEEPPVPVPEAPPTPAPASAAPAEAPYKPELDCTTFAGGPAPSVRFLCELAMGRRPASSLVDTRGYAYVQFAPDQEKARVCGADAVAKLGELLDDIRQKLSRGTGGPWVSCKGLVCDVRAEGEWMTRQRLYFRSGANGPVLEAWTVIEVNLVPLEEVAARRAWIERARWALAAKRCGR